MPTDAFISYAHADEPRRDRLHKHLATLRRDGLLREWSDHEILAGDSVAGSISDALERSGLFLALLSPDYLASSYCYDTEFRRAVELHEQGKMRIIGVVVEPCDWQNSPFGKLLVLPKDGKAVPEWTNENTAYLNVVQELRRVLQQPTATARPEERSISKAPAQAARSLKVKQDFDSIQKSAFADEAFEKMRTYFEEACKELPEASEHLRTSFEMMGSAAFTCTIVNRAKTRNSEAHITVRRNKGGRMSVGDVSFVYARHAEDNTANGWLSVHADEYALHLQGTIERFGMSHDKLWTAETAAEALWNVFMTQAGIDFA